jgi:hypothetical protein
VIEVGHKKPESDDRAVAAIVDGTRGYIRDFAQAAKNAGDVDELVSIMMGEYRRRGTRERRRPPLRSGSPGKPRRIRDDAKIAILFVMPRRSASGAEDGGLPPGAWRTG